VPLNGPQRLFLNQARSDYEIFRFLRGREICQRLHYLQMCTEKLSKVWFWRTVPPPHVPGHYPFEPFLRALHTSGRADFHRMFGYRSARRLVPQWPSILALALRIQRLVPGPNNANPEYPWPRDLPTYSPLTHRFTELRDWSTTTSGLRLKIFVENILQDYEVYFP
jgi:hypothetical protein